MKKGIICLSVFAALPLFAQAEAPSYSYVEGSVKGYAVDIGPADLDFFGFGFEGSYEFTDQFFGQAAYRSLNDEVGNTDVDYSEWSIGGGYVFYDQADTNAYAGAEYISADLDIQGFGSADGDGYGIFVGVRSQMSSQFELNGELAYHDIENDNQTTIKAGFIYSFVDNLGLNVNVSSTDGDLGWLVGARYSF
jgi:hypothetical protein